MLVKVGPKQWERYGLKSWIEAAKQELDVKHIWSALAPKSGHLSRHAGWSRSCQELTPALQKSWETRLQYQPLRGSRIV